MTPSDKGLDAWLIRVVPRAVAYARTLLGRPDRAEDVVQDVLCRLLDHPEYDLLRDGEKLLFRSITNACINEATRRRQMLSLDERTGDGDALLDALDAASPGDPATVAASRDLMAAVERELGDLPSMQRAALELKAMGMPLARVAEALDVTASNAGVLVHRARKQLRARLGPILPGEFR